MQINKASYPRPDFIRTNWKALNGIWDFAMDFDNQWELTKEFQNTEYPEKIIVPYCYQSKASGIGRDEYCPVVWYRRKFTITSEEKGLGNVLLHFGAVDWLSKIWVNDTYIGEHQGGSTPFSFNISNVITCEAENTIIVKAEDYLDPGKPQGKQSCIGQPFGCWYTPTTGIWQEVWLEFAGSKYLQRVKITPNLTDLSATVEFWISSKEKTEVSVTSEYKTDYHNTQHMYCQNGYGKCSISFPDRDIRPDSLIWSPSNPKLIDITIKVFGDFEDIVQSYFGLRQVSIQNGQVLLNGKPFYQKLILDQGYWPDTLMTPPSLEALEQDIDLAMAMGFNGARKHQKIEDPRYYYLADIKGFVVWGELPSSYQFDDRAIARSINELGEFVARDFNHPSLITWVPINESWGVNRIIDNTRQQEFCKTLTHLLGALDGTRLVSSNDGWEQLEGDLCAIHDYVMLPSTLEKYEQIDSLITSYTDHRMLYANGYSHKDQPILITEFGGVAFDDGKEQTWGYNDKVKNLEDFINRLQPVLDFFKSNKRIVGFCYTQLTDIMQETNGLLDENHNPKMSLKILKKLFG